MFHLISNRELDQVYIESQQEVDHEPNFSITQERLAELLQINDAVSLEQQNGGIPQITSALKSNIDTGISGDKRDINCRQRNFGFNWQLEEEEQDNNPTDKSFHKLVLEAFKDSTIILLLCCAMLSLLIGIKTNGPQEGLVDGTILFLSIVVVLNFSLISRFLTTRLMIRKLKKQKSVVSVIRRGIFQEIPVPDLVVGDVVFLEAGNEVPADGFFIHGSDSFKLDESGMIKYASIFSGAKVVDGNCRMLVTAVGKNTERSKLMGTVLRNCDNKEPKLQVAIDKMNCRLENLWLILSLIILSVQALRCFMQKSSASDDERHNNPDPKGLKNTVEEIMNESTKIMKKRGGNVNGLVSLLCILILATRDGLPLGILVLCFCSSRKMKSFGAKVHKLPSCINIGLVSSIVLGKTNALTLRPSAMAELWIGFKRVEDLSEEVNNQLVKIFREGIGVTSSVQGTKEYSLLFWSKKMLGLDIIMEEGYRNSTVLYNDIGNCCMSILTNDEEENQVHEMLHWKGAPDFILSLCSDYYDLEGTMQILDEEKRQLFTRLIEDIGSKNCFGFAFKKIIQAQENVIDEETFMSSIFHGFAFVALVRFKSPYAPELMETLASFRALGINVKLVVDDDLNTARIMALNCGILLPGENEEAAILESSDFRNMSSVEARMNMIGNIHVIANASPVDKLLMVQCLRKKDEVVAITSSFKRDSPSLLEADVGIFMDNEEDADIIIWKKIGTIASIIKLGRYVCKQIETFLQLHLILNLSAFALNFILEVLRSEAQLTSFHLLWTNLIVETLGALALSTSRMDPSTSIPPILGNGPLITKKMWRNIAIQSLFQVIILLVLALKGKDILHVDENVLCTMVFNCYVLCQVFALISTITSCHGGYRHGRTIHYLFLLMIVITVIVGLQILVVEIMRFFSHWGTLDYKKWFISIGIAAVSVPIGYAAQWLSSVIVLMISYFSMFTCRFFQKHVNFCNLQ